MTEFHPPCLHPKPPFPSFPPSPSTTTTPAQVGLGSVSDFVTKHSTTNVVVHKMAQP